MGLTSQVQVVDHAVEVSEVLQLPDTGWSDGASKRDEEMGCAVREVGAGGVLHHHHHLPHDGAGEVCRDPSVGAVLETLAVQRSQPVAPGLKRSDRLGVTPNKMLLEIVV